MPIESAIKKISLIIGNRLKTSQAIRKEHSKSEAHYPEYLPDAVAFVNSTNEISKILKICNDELCPIVAWGTGTGLEGHALAVSGGITLNMMNMDKILKVNSEDMDVVVQPGVKREQLNDYLRQSGLFFSVDPGANASLGGMAATRASGTTSVRYGTMKENVMALEFVTADGRIIRSGSRARKSSSGYDLTKLLVGSEGTLGIITELTLKLHGRPEAMSSAVCAFPTIDAAVQTVIATIQTGVPIARMEFIDTKTADILNYYSKSSLDSLPHLFMEFHGSETSVVEQAEQVKQIASDFQASGFEWSHKEEQRNKIWKMRHNVLYAYKSYYSNCTLIATDVCVPISKLAQIVNETQRDIEKSGISGPIIGHVGDGNFHSTLMIRDKNSKDVEVANELAHRMNERALKMGGTVSGEHGVGIGKIKYMEKEHGEAWNLMSSIKKNLDPNCILNPGKLIKQH
ncbi:MAG: FAD-linked oxidase C-terminal domain-containing protein [Paracoccaceae bacterium]|nr:FAD-linked oxidase C-terminal domain-containing protein [Paracoccaceae bacterium]